MKRFQRGHSPSTLRLLWLLALTLGLTLSFAACEDDGPTPNKNSSSQTPPGGGTSTPSQPQSPSGNGDGSKPEPLPAPVYQSDLVDPLNPDAENPLVGTWRSISAGGAGASDTGYTFHADGTFSNFITISQTGNKYTLTHKGKYKVIDKEIILYNLLQSQNHQSIPGLSYVDKPVENQTETFYFTVDPVWDYDHMNQWRQIGEETKLNFKRPYYDLSLSRVDE